MEHIKQQIEALREQADQLAQVFNQGFTSHITIKLINANGSEYFTEQEATEIDRLMKESGCFNDKAVSDGCGGKVPWFYCMRNANFEWSFVIRLTVKESRDTEMDRLRRRLAELEGGER